MVVSAMQNLMSTEWGKSIQATKSLFAYGPNGNIEATHSIQFCFPDEAAFESAFMSYGQSMEAQMRLVRLSCQASEEQRLVHHVHG